MSLSALVSLQPLQMCGPSEHDSWVQRTTDERVPGHLTSNKYFLTIYVRQSVRTQDRITSDMWCGSLQSHNLLGNSHRSTWFRFTGLVRRECPQPPQTREKSSKFTGAMLDARVPLNLQALSLSFLRPCLLSYSLVNACVGAFTHTYTDTLIHSSIVVSCFMLL